MVSRIAALLLLVAGLVPTWQGPLAAERIRLVDRVVAVVNNEVITSTELATRVEQVSRQLKQQNISLPPSDVLERQVLERMITDRVQQQRAREVGLKVDDAELAVAIERVAAENRLSVNGLRERLVAEGLGWNAFREEIRGEILRVRLREREIDSRVRISEADVDAFLADQSASGADSTSELQVAQILLPVREGAGATDVDAQRKRADDIIAQLRGGADFGRLAAAYSAAPEAMSGGSLGWRSPERLPKLFLDALEKVAPGAVAGPVRSPAGFHVLKLLGRRGGSSGGGAIDKPVERTRARHILIRPNELVSEAEALRRLNDIRERVLKGGEDFGELARQYSVDGSAARGGELGWVYPGDTVPEFERAMNALKPGQLSEPVRSPFGLHLIQVLERRTDRSSPERQRQLARAALREKRIAQAFDDWIRQMRDSAYVEYRLEER
ncbi:MAG: peptidylprolyl isomerase [Burkholderiaceae bacterium]|nr:peptidylprolyl isomerase [Burkholderiaceae bacterium]